MAVKMIHQKNTIFLFALIYFLIIPEVRSKRMFFLSLILKKMARVFILLRQFQTISQKWKGSL